MVQLYLPLPRFKENGPENYEQAAQYEAEDESEAQIITVKVLSKRNALILTTCAALATFITVFHSLTLRTLIAIICASLAGAALGQLISKRGAHGKASLLMARFNGGGGSGVERTGESASLGRLFEATMNGMREGVLVIDREMRVVASNFAARAVFAYAKGTPDSQRLSEITRNPAIYKAFLDALGGKERAGIKIETYGPERRIFDLRVVPLTVNEGENIQGAIGVFFDITRLESLERVRQEFLSNVSHELRTPLTAILAFVETLEDGAIDDREHNRRFLSIIRRNSARMQTLIDDILELSAIEAGNVQVEPSIVPLAAVVSDVLLALNAKANARRVTLSNQVEETVKVRADERRLEQMLTNLIDNAIKFNQEGGTVKIKHERSAHDEIHVIDTGEGIPADHLERLFERFYRVDRARSREMGGTGLGLAIVKHLARAHGGEVIVHSALGEGSTFILRLPVDEASRGSA